MNLYDVETSYENGLAAQSSGLSWDELAKYLRALKDYHTWDELTISRRRAVIEAESHPIEPPADPTGVDCAERWEGIEP